MKFTEDEFDNWGGSLKIEQPKKSNYKKIVIIGLVGLILIFIGILLKK